MRSLIGSALAATLLAASAHAAGTEDHLDRTVAAGRVELSTAASFTLLKEDGVDGSLSVLTIPLRLGWFVSRRVSLEGETLLSRLSYLGDGDTGVTVSGAALYHLHEGRTVPFVLGGAGIGTGVELGGRVDGDADRITHLQAGAGLKSFFGSRAALRAEYRFRRLFHRDLAADPAEFRATVKGTDHRLFLGLSLFFR